MRRILEDHLSLMGLPGPMVEVLDAEIARLGLDTQDPREYLRHLLTLSYRDLLTARVESAHEAKGAERKAPARR